MPDLLRGHHANDQEIDDNKTQSPSHVISPAKQHVLHHDGADRSCKSIDREKAQYDTLNPTFHKTADIERAQQLPGLPRQKVPKKHGKPEKYYRFRDRA